MSYDSWLHGSPETVSLVAPELHLLPRSQPLSRNLSIALIEWIRYNQFIKKGFLCITCQV
jgi:hypothetical protein